jgi:elongation factor Ts
MQAAAMNPISLDRSSVPAKVIETELEVGREKAREEGKPENMLEKIAEGRLNKFYQESTLVEQAFIKDNKLTVAAYLKANGATATAFKRVTLNQE